MPAAVVSGLSAAHTARPRAINNNNDKTNNYYKTNNYDKSDNDNDNNNNNNNNNNNSNSNYIYIYIYIYSDIDINMNININITIDNMYYIRGAHEPRTARPGLAQSHSARNVCFSVCIVQGTFS